MRLLIYIDRPTQLKFVSFIVFSKKKKKNSSKTKVLTSTARTRSATRPCTWRPTGISRNLWRSSYSEASTPWSRTKLNWPRLIWPRPRRWGKYSATCPTTGANTRASCWRKENSSASRNTMSSWTRAPLFTTKTSWLIFDWFMCFCQHFYCHLQKGRLERL